MKLKGASLSKLTAYRDEVIKHAFLVNPLRHASRGMLFDRDVLGQWVQLNWIWWPNRQEVRALFEDCRRVIVRESIRESNIIGHGHQNCITMAAKNELLKTGWKYYLLFGSDLFSGLDYSPFFLSFGPRCKSHFENTTWLRHELSKRLVAPKSAPLSNV